MLQTLKNNPKLLTLAIIVATCTVITSIPGSIDFIESISVQKTVKGVAGIVTLVSAMLGFKISPNPETGEK